MLEKIKLSLSKWIAFMSSNIPSHGKKGEDQCNTIGSQRMGTKRATNTRMDELFATAHEARATTTESNIQSKAIEDRKEREGGESKTRTEADGMQGKITQTRTTKPYSNHIIYNVPDQMSKQNCYIAKSHCVDTKMR